MKEELLEAIRELTLPADFLDNLISDLGGSKKVAEMTGRQSRLEKERGRFILKQRSSKSAGVDSVNSKAMRLFSP